MITLIEIAVYSTKQCLDKTNLSWQTHNGKLRNPQKHEKTSNCFSNQSLTTILFIKLSSSLVFEGLDA